MESLVLRTEPKALLNLEWQLPTHAWSTRGDPLLIHPSPTRKHVAVQYSSKLNVLCHHGGLLLPVFDIS
jgi:hypothetical protein